VWRYDDKTAVSYIPWGRGQPGNGIADIYLDLWTIDSYRIHDVTGNSAYGSVCEIEMK